MDMQIATVFTMEMQRFKQDVVMQRWIESRHSCQVLSRVFLDTLDCSLITAYAE
jgi:hypothetical protein